MAISKKEFQQKLEQQRVIKELENAAKSLEKRRESYIEQARLAYKSGNTAEYNSKIALIKNRTFNIAQTHEMLTNFTIAKDLYEQNMLNKTFVKSFNSVMKKVNKTCSSINVKASEKIYNKALLKSGNVSVELKEMLENNNVTFASVVNSVSDISDEEIKGMITGNMEKDDAKVEAELQNIEAKLFGKAPETLKVEEKPAQIREGEKPTVKPVEEKPSEKKVEAPHFETPKQDSKAKTPEDDLLNGDSKPMEYEFKWDDTPSVSFEDIAGLDEAKDMVRKKVLLPLKNPELLEGYETKGGGGLCLYGPAGTGKTMFAAALAHEINAKFCSIVPSDILKQGLGNSEKAIKQLFREARSFACAVIYFDEMDSIAPKRTLSTAARQIRSEFLAQLQGIQSYSAETKNILFVVCATNKPWDIDSAFLRPGRFGTRVYVGLPDEEARRYLITRKLNKINEKGIVKLIDIDVEELVNKTNGFNGADITNLLAEVQEDSATRSLTTGEKYIDMNDFTNAFGKVRTTVQIDDIVKLKEWKGNNDIE